MRSLIDAEKAFAARVVDARKAEGLDAATALVRTGEGKRTMDALRDVTRTAQTMQVELWRSRATGPTAQPDLVSVSGYLGFLASL